MTTIFHAGDIGDSRVIRELERIAPVAAISGNVDQFERSGFPRLRIVRRAGVIIAMRHILFERGRLTDEARKWLDDTQPHVCIFGHSHRPAIDQHGGTILFNPGSAGPRRFFLPRGVGVLTIQEGRIMPELIRLKDSVGSDTLHKTQITCEERNRDMMKETRMRRIMASAVLAGFMLSSTACYGPFNLTRNVYHWNSGVKGSGEVNDKWMKEFVFFGMIVVPVYMFSALLDAFIFNSIQFWSGDNPVKVTQDEDGRIRAVQLGTITADVTWAEDRKSAQVTYVRQGQVVKQVTVEQNGDQLRLRDEGGQVQVTAETPGDGSLRLIGRDGRVADAIGPEQVRWGVAQLRGEHS